jgi:hypothetical protein
MFVRLRSQQKTALLARDEARPRGTTLISVCFYLRRRLANRSCSVTARDRIRLICDHVCRRSPVGSGVNFSRGLRGRLAVCGLSLPGRSASGLLSPSLPLDVSGFRVLHKYVPQVGRGCQGT